MTDTPERIAEPTNQVRSERGKMNEREEAIRLAFEERAVARGWDLGLLGASELAEVAERAVTEWDRGRGASYTIQVRQYAPPGTIMWDGPQVWQRRSWWRRLMWWRR